MLRNLIILNILLIPLLNSCNNKGQSTLINIKEIKISPEKSDDKVLQTLIKEIKTIKLETTDSSLIKFIFRLEYVKNKYFIQGESNKPVLVFDSAGNFNYQIGKCGRGPKEFVQLGDMSVIDNKIILFSWPDKTLFYTLEGKYLNEIKAKFPLTKSVMINNNLYALYFGRGTSMPDGELPYSIIFTDSSFNIVSKFNKRKPYENKYGVFTTIFSKYGEGINYLGEYKDTVYLIKDSNNIVPQYFLNFGKYQINDEFLKKYQNSNPVEYFDRVKKNYATFIKFSQNDHFFWIEYCLFLNEFNKHFAIFSKVDSKVYNFSYTKNHPLTRLLSNLVSSSGDTFIFSIEAAEFLEVVQNINNEIINGKLKKEKYIDEIISFSSQIKETNNPILLKITMI